MTLINSIKNNNTKVQMEEVSLDQLDANPDMKHLLEGSTVVKWGDQGFWNKLRYFLPEPVTMRGTLSSSNLYHPVLG